ncbi:Bgt-20036 [Blumeria graminis f. sp. tritici]|uniref:Bgt-20036 n=2 Tax=Blumeria graminis f. sp. tritici TaxID=62690 RepID=A0A9X9QBV4_BLUGR|nr:Bgt-20036 [Blumeria graminis f. sp. tritici]
MTNTINSNGSATCRACQTHQASQTSSKSLQIPQRVSPLQAKTC